MRFHCPELYRDPSIKVLQLLQVPYEKTMLTFWYKTGNFQTWEFEFLCWMNLIGQCFSPYFWSGIIWVYYKHWLAAAERKTSGASPRLQAGLRVAVIFCYSIILAYRSPLSVLRSVPSSQHTGEFRKSDNWLESKNLLFQLAQKYSQNCNDSPSILRSCHYGARK